MRAPRLRLRDFGKNLARGLALTSTGAENRAVDDQFLRDMRQQCLSQPRRADCDSAAYVFHRAVSGSPSGYGNQTSSTRPLSRATC